MTGSCEAADPRLDPFRAVRRPDALRAAGLFAAEGRRVVRAALGSADVVVQRVLATPAAAAALADALGDSGVPVVVAAAEVHVEVGGYRTRGGALALARRLPARTASELLDAPAGPSALVALDAVADPDNLGSLFRSARALGAGGLLLGPRCADPWFRKCVRTSIGAVLELPFAALDDWGELAEGAREHGHCVLALAPDGERSLDEGVPERVVFVLGNEGAGIAPAARAAADEGVRIRMEAGADSLNVAVAGAVALWAWRAGAAGVGYAAGTGRST